MSGSSSAVLGSTSSRRRRFRRRPAERLATIAIMLVAPALIALIWILASHAIETNRDEVRARLEATLTGQSMVLADEVRREFLSVEQSLRILEQAYAADPDHFDLHAWLEKLPAIADVSDELFVVDDKQIIRQATHPQVVGLALGSPIAWGGASRAARIDRQDSLFVGPALGNIPGRQDVILLMLRLERPDGWMVGTGYRTGALSRVFAEAGLGVQGMTAMVNMRTGRIQAIAGPAALQPMEDITASAMYAAMNARPDGIWVGPSAPDNVDRIHAFRRVPDRLQAVVVAVDANEALRPATEWAHGVQTLAAAATALVLAGAALALYAVWSLRWNRHLRESLERERALTADTQTELHALQERLQQLEAQASAGNTA
jgi:hypothetical protein